MKIKVFLGLFAPSLMVAGVPNESGGAAADNGALIELAASTMDLFPAIDPKDPINIPRVYVLGEQSSAKSALLEALTGVMLPSMDGTWYVRKKADRLLMRPNSSPLAFIPTHSTRSAMSIESIYDPNVETHILATVSYYGGTPKNGKVVTLAENIKDSSTLVMQISKAEKYLCGNQQFAKPDQRVHISVRSRFVSDMLVTDLPGALPVEDANNQAIRDFQLKRENAIVLGVQACDKMNLKNGKLNGPSIVLMEELRKSVMGKYRIQDLMVLTKPDLCRDDVIAAVNEKLCDDDPNSPPWFAVQSLSHKHPRYGRYVSDPEFRARFRANEAHYMLEVKPELEPAFDQCREKLGSSRLRDAVIKIMESSFSSVAQRLNPRLSEREMATSVALGAAMATTAGMTIQKKAIFEKIKTIYSDLISSALPSSTLNARYNAEMAGAIKTFSSAIAKTLESTSLVTAGSDPSDEQRAKYNQLKDEYANSFKVTNSVPYVVQLRLEKVTEDWRMISMHFVDEMSKAIREAVEKNIQSDPQLSNWITSEGEIVEQFLRNMEIFLKSRFAYRRSSTSLGQQEVGQSDSYEILESFLEEAGTGYTTNLLHLLSTRQIWFNQFVDHYEEPSDRYSLSNAWFKNHANHFVVGDHEHTYRALWRAAPRGRAQHSLSVIPIECAYGDQHKDSRLMSGVVSDNLQDYREISKPAWRLNNEGRTMYAERKFAKSFHEGEFPKTIPIYDGVQLDEILAAMASVSSYLEMASYRFIQNVFGLVHMEMKRLPMVMEKLAAEGMESKGPIFNLPDFTEARQKVTCLEEEIGRIHRCQRAVNNWDNVMVHREDAEYAAAKRNRFERNDHKDALFGSNSSPYSPPSGGTERFSSNMFGDFGHEARILTDMDSSQILSQGAPSISDALGPLDETSEKGDPQQMEQLEAKQVEDEESQE